MNFAPTISRCFDDGTPASVLLIRPDADEQSYYGAYGFALCEVFENGDVIDTAPLLDDQAVFGWVWMNEYGGVA